MKDSDTIDSTTIDKKMNVIIGLLSKIAHGGDQTIIDRITELSAYGLTNPEVAGIVGKETEYVRKALYKVKNNKK